MFSSVFILGELQDVMQPSTNIEGCLGEVVARLGEKLRQRQQCRQPAPALEQNIQLPLWPESMRGTPNAWLRSALFAAIQGKKRQALKRQLLATVAGVEIRFTGWQLDQSDRDVLDTIVHLGRGKGMGLQELFSARALLVELGLNTGKGDHEWLKDCMARLYSAGVEITVGRFTYFGTLLKGARDELAGRYVVELDPRLLSMYDSGWTQIEWAERQALRRKPLAQWLHGWFCSHAVPYPLKVETLRGLSGSCNCQLASFRRQLGKALGDLGKVGAITGWELRGDMVHVTRCPTSTQRKHLARKAAKNKSRKI